MAESSSPKGGGFLSFLGGSSSAEKNKEPPSPSVDPSTIVNAIVPTFIKSIPPKSESGFKSKSDVQQELERKKKSVLEKLRNGFQKNKVVADHHIDELCIKLDKELNNVIQAYLKSVSDAACKSAKEIMITVIPQEPQQISISLPAGEKKVEAAIKRKKQQVQEELTKQMDKFHVTWYGEEIFVIVGKEMDKWGETVHTRSKELAKYWTLRSSFFLAMILPLTMSMVLYTTRYCKPGYSSVLVPPWKDIITPQTCAICPPGTSSTGGFFSSAVCQPCSLGHYSASKGARECVACPSHSESIQNSGSTGCVCTNDATQLSTTGQSLVCQSNHKIEKTTATTTTTATGTTEEEIEGDEDQSEDEETETEGEEEEDGSEEEENNEDEVVE